MAQAPRVPRVSLVASVMRDKDYRALVLTEKGRVAWGCFCALLAEARNQNNHGVFREPMPAVASAIGWPAKVVARSVSLIASTCESNGDQPWIVVGDGLVIRSYDKWNHHENWGGDRYKMNVRKESSCSHDVTTPSDGGGGGISSCLPEGGTGGKPITAGDRYVTAQDFSMFWQAVPRKRQADKAACHDAFIAAVQQLGATPARLTLRIAEYYASSVAGGGFWVGPLNWLKRGKWDDAPEAWGDERTKLKQQAKQRERSTAPAPTGSTGALERIKRERAELERKP